MHDVEKMEESAENVLTKKELSQNEIIFSFCDSTFELSYFLKRCCYELAIADNSFNIFGNSVSISSSEN